MPRARLLDAQAPQADWIGEELLSAEQLREVLHYNPLTGNFTWLNPHYSKPSLQNKKAGSLNPKDGYVRIGLNGQSYLAHRLAWLYMTGEWPPELIDHRDVNGSNNSFSNLRLASHSENHTNTNRRSDNTSGHKGVSLRWDKKKWLAFVNYKGRRVYTEAFDSYEQACAAQEIAAEKHHGNFARIA